MARDIDIKEIHEEDSSPGKDISDNGRKSDLNSPLLMDLDQQDASVCSWTRHQTIPVKTEKGSRGGFADLIVAEKTSEYSLSSKTGTISVTHETVSTVDGLESHKLESFIVDVSSGEILSTKQSTYSAYGFQPAPALPHPHDVAAPASPAGGSGGQALRD